MWTVIFIMTTIFALIQWRIERIKFKALLYYIVDKEYTAPTKEELERCISVAAGKTVEKIFTRKQ